MIEAVDTAQTTNNNILIVGGSGYLGRFLIDGFARAGWNVSFTFKTCYDLDFNRGFAVRGYKVRHFCSCIFIQGIIASTVLIILHLFKILF